MNSVTPFASIQHNFANGISLGENFLDEETWNSLSPGAQEAMLQLSETSIDYMDSAIGTAISNDVGFPYLWKQVTLQSMQKQVNIDEKIDRETEQSSLLSLIS